MSDPSHHWPLAGAGAPQRQAQLALMFPVKLPAEYRWRFDNDCGPWQALGDRAALSPPPNATGIEWRIAPPASISRAAVR